VFSYAWTVKISLRTWTCQSMLRKNFAATDSAGNGVCFKVVIACGDDMDLCESTDHLVERARHGSELGKRR
jgi:hypothetical protein